MVYIDCNYIDIDQNRIETFINFILDLYCQSNKEVSVTVISDQDIQELNYKYRNIDKPTDVLSFALLEGEYMGDDTMLGDIVISYDTAKRQAKELNHPLNIEIDNLVCHSMLHLFGYDHMTEQEKEEMFTEHKSILSDFYTKTGEIMFIKDNWLLD